MTWRFPIKHVARQAGVSTATVDRVLNGRGMVRLTTAARVRSALAELEAQEGQLARSGPQMIIDVVAEAPREFLDALQAALHVELPLQAIAVRARMALRTCHRPDALARLLEGILRRGSDGVVLMADDTAGLRNAVNQLEAAGIPVVTLASDIRSRRRAYVGLDNRRAGATAAWLVSRWASAGSAPHVLVTLRNASFRSEEEREIGFRHTLATLRPRAKVTMLVEGDHGADFLERVTAAASAVSDPPVLYSIGGSTGRILLALDAVGRRGPLVIAHDLSQDNAALLAQGRVDVVLFHDLADDIRTACRVIVSGQRRQPASPGVATLRMAVPPMLGL